MIPPVVSQAVAAGQGQPITVDVHGTLMVFVPDVTRDTPQVWWTRLGGWIESEGLVTSRRHGKPREQRTGFKLSRLRFTDYLPGAKVLVWPTPWTTFIYVRKGLGKGEASRALRSAMAAAGRPALTPAHMAVVGFMVSGGFHVPLWLSKFPLPRSAAHAVLASSTLAAVAVSSTVFFPAPAPGGHAHPHPHGGDLSPVVAQPIPPTFPQPTGRALPSVYVQAQPSPSRLPSATPVKTHRVTAPPTPSPSSSPSSQPADTPTPRPTPDPEPSSVLSGGGVSPSSWPSWFPSGW